MSFDYFIEDNTNANNTLDLPLINQLQTLDPYYEENKKYARIIQMLNRGKSKFKLLRNQLNTIQLKYVTPHYHNTSINPLLHLPKPSNPTRNSLIINTSKTKTTQFPHRKIKLKIRHTSNSRRLTPLNIYKEAIKEIVVHKKPTLENFICNRLRRHIVYKPIIKANTNCSFQE